MKQFIIIIYFCFQSIFLLAQNTQVKFTNYTIDDGLSLSSIYCILEDSQGFMWFGTEDGLNRFDGIDFEIFRPKLNDSNSISNRWIENIFEDNSGFLWIFTQGGLNKYNPRTKQFQSYKFDNNDVNSISSNQSTCIFQDDDDNVWIGTNNGLNLYNKSENYFERFFINKNAADSSNIITNITQTENFVWIGTKSGLFSIDKSDFSITNYKIYDEIHSIFIENDNLWLATDNGLVIFEPKTQNIKRHLHQSDDINSISDNYVENIFKDSENNFWISTKVGFDIYNPFTQKFTVFIETEGRSLSLSENNTRPIFEDNLKTIWFGTYGNGLYSYNLKTKKLNNYLHNSNDNNSISENSINSITQDNSNVIWFGTFGAGLSTYDPYKQKFNLLENKPSKINTLSSNFVWSIHEDESGIVWIGTNDAGVDKYDPKTENFKNYRNIPNNNNSLSNNCVREIFQDSKKNLWFGTNGDGLNKFNIETEKFTVYKHNPDNEISISNNSVRVIFEDKDGILWIGTQNGLNKFDSKKETFKSYYSDPNDSTTLSNNFIYSGIFQDSEGLLWIGTYGGGLCKFDIETEIFTRYKHNAQNKNSIINDKVFYIQEDDKGNLWISTNGGLEYFDKNTEIFTHYSTANGLPNNVIYGALLLKTDLWISTNYGISNYNISTKEFKNYIKSDGLQSNEFNGGAFHKGKSGTIYFAGVNGLNYFKPENIILNPSPPVPIIKGFLIFNKKITINSELKNNKIVEKDGEYFINQDIVFSDEIILSYKEKVFSFELAALHYSNPEENIYAYRLRDFENDWNETQNRNFVTYTSIPPGEYFFEFKVANSDGVWSDVKTLKIIITPPIWQTTWFYIVVGLLIVLIIFGLYKFKVRQIKNKNKKLEEQVLERTYEIREKNEELRQQKNEIEKNHQNITSSINYASRIQQALLPSEKLFSESFKEHFILYKPKDIVSGDFYYFKKIDEFIIIAAADCTGHGIPGAFVSMLGISFMNEIIRKKEITTAADILEELRIQVKAALSDSKSGVKTQDGMDMALCVINTKTNILNYAGAYNPLYLIRNNELTHIKATRNPIGIYLNEYSFENHKIKLLKDDSFYMFSDGYIDQFNGINRHKFTSKQLKELFLSIHKEPFVKQKTILNQTIEKWKGNSEQIDDILVLGMKINSEIVED